MFDFLNEKQVLVFLLAIIVLAMSLMLWMSKRLRQLKMHNNFLVAEAEKDREIIASIQDGLFLWDRHNASEKCSRQLAVLLNLEAGSKANFKNVLEKFPAREASILNEATKQLHLKGLPFNLVLKVHT